MVGYGYGADSISFWVISAERPVPADEKSGLHFCFVAPDVAAIDAFYGAALRAGGHDNGAPGLRPIYGPDYYAAFIIDPDGYRIEVCYGPAKGDRCIKWPRPLVFRRERNEDRLLDSAASAHAQFPAELEGGRRLICYPSSATIARPPNGAWIFCAGPGAVLGPRTSDSAVCWLVSMRVGNVKQ